MGFCVTCGSALPPTGRFCTTCGAASAAATLPVQAQFTAPQFAAPVRGLYHVSYASGQTAGPVTEDTIRTMIAQQQIHATDSIQLDGSNCWLPVAQSYFAPLFGQQPIVPRAVLNTCPGCGAPMAVVIKRSKGGLALVVIGICLIPFIIGIPIFIVGYIMRFGGKGKAGYQCPRCNYAT